MVRHDAVVDEVQRGQVLQGRRAAQRVVVPRAGGHECARGAGGGDAQGGDALREDVHHPADQLDLGVEHLVHADEAGAHHVPVGVLQGELQVVEGVQATLEDLGGAAARAQGQARDGVLGGVLLGHGGAPSPLGWARRRRRPVIHHPTA